MPLHDGLLPWVVGLQDSVAELRGVLADLGAKQWELQVCRRATFGARALCFVLTCLPVTISS
jgi:hypothetical protein